MMTKRIMHLLLIGIFCSLSLNIFSQVTGPSDGDGNPPPDEDLPIMTESEGGKTFKNCAVGFTYQIFAANLQQGLGGIYRLPFSAPPMYLKVTMINELGEHIFRETYPVTNWQLIPGTLGNLEEGDDGLDETAFVAGVDIEAPIGEHCVNTGGDEIFMEVELIAIAAQGPGGGPNQTNGTEYPYPICEHTAPGGLYSCNVFLGVPCHGDPNGGVCNSNDLTYIGESFIPDCYCFDDSGFKGGAGGFRSTNGDANGSLLAEQAFKISTLSNPFQDQLQLNWLGNTDLATEAAIYNTNGQLIERISLREEAGQHTLRTTDWTSGLYFLVSGTGENQQVLKLLKQ